MTTLMSELARRDVHPAASFERLRARPIQREPGALADARVAVEKRGLLARDRFASMSPPSAFSSISIQPAYGRGPSSAASQMSPLPSCRKSRSAKPRATVLHVVAERAHARHDRVAVVLARQARGDTSRARRVRADPIAPRPPSARTRRAAAARRRDAAPASDGAATRARCDRRPTASAGADRLDRDQRHHVADPERVAVDERAPTAPPPWRAARAAGSAPRAACRTERRRTSSEHPPRQRDRQRRAAQHVHAPADLRPRPSSDRPSALFSGTKKPPATNQSPTTTRLKTTKATIATAGYDRDRARRRATRRPGVAAAPSHPHAAASAPP